MAYYRNKFVGKYYCFNVIGKKIGHGGNGIVFDIELTEENKTKQPLVVKIFTQFKDKKRYERFKREVNFVFQHQKSISGIMEIIDFFLPDKPTLKKPAWYLMPKANKYLLRNNNTLIEKIRDMLTLANILKELHTQHYAHRDIKPENLLILNGNIMLCDFGLLWNENQERLTVKNERIGPYKILPPELREVNISSDLDLIYSDVYLFAKTLWMILREDNFGFFGEYNRQSALMYLDNNIFNCPCLEPIHQLLEFSTKDKITERYNIAECIEKINDQILILDESIDADRLKEYQFLETNRKYLADNTPTFKVYSHVNDIVKYIDINKKIITISIDEKNNEKKTKFNIQTVERYKDIFVSIKYPFGTQVYEIIFSPNQLTIEEATLSGKISIKKIDNPDTAIYSEYIGFKRGSMPLQKQYLTGDYEISFGLDN